MLVSPNFSALSFFFINKPDKFFKITKGKDKIFIISFTLIPRLKIKNIIEINKIEIPTY